MEAGLIDEVQLKAALAEQRKWGGRLGRTVVELGFTTELDMVHVLAQQLSLSTIDLDAAKLPERIVEQLRLDLAERYGVFPLRVDAATKTMSLATSDPTNVEALQELEFATGMKVVPTVTTASSIDRAIRRHYFGESTIATAVLTPAQLGLSEPSYELDKLMGRIPSAPRPPTAASLPPAQLPVTPATPSTVLSKEELALRREVSLLREQVDALETINASQVRALRTLLEILIASGIVSRDEYLERLHRPE
ncbi:MAG: general secretion pathway protein GspE [Archangium sp.]|nr:general secretion pathway protein GspE [Archangium sp.]